MSIEANQSVQTDGTVASSSGHAGPGQHLVRTRTGHQMPGGALETGIDLEAKAREARRERVQQRLRYALGALGLTAFGAIIALLARAGGERASLQTALHDFGYVVAERKGIGIDR